MGKDLLAAELVRIQKRDKKHTNILIVGYTLITIFGFLAITLSLNSLKNRYEGKFNDFEKSTITISANLEKQINLSKELGEQIENEKNSLLAAIRESDESIKKIDQALENTSADHKEEINKLWRGAYLKSVKNEKDIAELRIEIHNLNNSYSKIEQSLNELSDKISGLTMGLSEQQVQINALQNATTEWITREQTLTMFEDATKELELKITELQRQVQVSAENLNQLINPVPEN